MRFCCRSISSRSIFTVHPRISMKRRSFTAAAASDQAEPELNKSEDPLDLAINTPSPPKRRTASVAKVPPQDMGIQKLVLGAGAIPLADAALATRATGSMINVGLTPESLQQACAFLSANDERLAPLIEQHGAPERLLAKSPGGSFATLSKSICFQQLATQAAAKIYERVLDRCGVRDLIGKIAFATPLLFANL